MGHSNKTTHISVACVSFLLITSTQIKMGESYLPRAESLTVLMIFAANSELEVF